MKIVQILEKLFILGKILLVFFCFHFHFFHFEKRESGWEREEKRAEKKE